ncbi:hypothetical protein [Martelella sp. FOR1707]
MKFLAAIAWGIIISLFVIAELLPLPRIGRSSSPPAGNARLRPGLFVPAGQAGRDCCAWSCSPLFDGVTVGQRAGRITAEFFEKSSLHFPEARHARDH